MPDTGHTIFDGRQVDCHQPWPRRVVTLGTWMSAVERLVDGRSTLLGLWGEKDAVHMALLDGERGDVAVLTLECPDGRFQSVGRRHPPAVRLERAACDLFGLTAITLDDTRPWLDHGRWGVRHPLGRNGPVGAVEAYPFLPAEGESLHQIPVGPVHAGIIEPGHFRFTCNGEAVVRLEERLGYVHKGIEGLMAGATIDRAARLATRTSGDSMVAYGLGLARAVEAALGVEVPMRAHYLRALMAELERIANHLGDVGAVCNDAAFAIMLAHCAVLRERVLRAADACFGHRLMADCIVPGGVAADLGNEGVKVLSRLIGEVRAPFAELADLYDNTASIKDRTVGTGIVKAAMVRQYGAGGYVGRAADRDFDTRRSLAYAPYDALQFEVPLLKRGDVNARVWIRILEVEQSLRLIEQIIDRLPAGATRVDLPAPDEVREGMALVEGFRGDILVWLRLDTGGKVARCHLRDPSWFQWPLLEAAIEGNIVADFPLCNKSFNCSYSGHDL